MTEKSEITEQDQHGGAEKPRSSGRAALRAANPGTSGKHKELSMAQSLCLSLEPGLDAGRRPARDHCYPETSVSPCLRVEGLFRDLRILR